MATVAPAKLCHRRIARRCAGFTLTEVIITMVLIAVMCLGVFAGLQQITKATLGVALRNEAYHHLQQEAERLLTADYSDFTASSSDTKIPSAVKTSYSRSNVDPLKVTGFADNKAGRVTFTRRVVAVSNTATSRTLRVEVEWTWQARPFRISTPVYRNQ